MVFSKTQLVSFFTVAVIVAAGFFAVIPVFAAGNCCLYFTSEPSSKCNAYSAASNKNVKGFSCTSIVKDSGKTDYYFNFTDDEVKKNAVLGNFNDQNVNQSPVMIAHPDNFVGGYVDPSGKNCIAGAVFGAVLKKSADTGLYGLCGTDGSALKAINKNLDTPVYIGKLFDSYRPKFCCVPKPKTYAGAGLPVAGTVCSAPSKWANIGTSGVIPSLGPSLGDLFYSFTNKFPVASNGDLPVGSILSCGEITSSNFLLAPLSCGSTVPLSTDIATFLVGGAANLNDYSLSNYCSIKDQIGAYCSCKNDGTVCFDTKYEAKSECLSASPGSGYSCLPLEKGKTTCKDLLIKAPDQRPPDINVPFSVPDISDLNKLGTTDVTVVIGRVIKNALGIIGTIAFALFVYAGVLWMISGGSSDRVQKSRDILLWTSLGIAVIFASYALVDIIFEVFR